MIKIEFVLKNGELAMDLYKVVEGERIDSFTQEDWKEAYTLMLKVTEYIREDSNGGMV